MQKSTEKLQNQINNFPELGQKKSPSINQQMSKGN